jgi:hypothetical protein
MTEPVALFEEMAEALAALLRRETAILRSPSPAGIAALQPEKTRLGEVCTAVAAELRRSAPGLAPAARERVRQSAALLANAAADNERMLRASMAAADRIVGAIVAAVQAERGPCVSYNAERRRPRVSRAVAGVTLDRRF